MKAQFVAVDIRPADVQILQKRIIILNQIIDAAIEIGGLKTKPPRR